MADKNISSLIDKINQSKESLYSSIYYNDDLASQQIKRLRNQVNDIIDRISNNNINNTGYNNISVLYTKLFNINKNNDKNLIENINKALSDRNNMNNILSVYTQNSLVRELDREIDMVCKYMPKLDDALDTRREHVLSADHFSKNTIVIKSTNTSDLDSYSSSIQSNIETLKEKYNLEEFLDTKVYRPTDKYGEAFIYIVPYKRAIETLLKMQNPNGSLNNTNPDYMPPTNMVESFDLIESIIENDTVQMDTSQIIQEATSDFNKLAETMKYSEAIKDFELGTIRDSGNIKIEINKSKIIKSAIQERFNTEKIMNENASLFFNEKADDENSIFNKKALDKFTQATKDPNSLSSDGVTLLNKENVKSGSIKIPGCIVKDLEHEMVKPLYIDNTCLGYFYIECDKKISLEQTTYSSTIGGIRPGNAYKTGNDIYRNSSNEYIAIKNIANEISKKITANFINANQDLSKEIYSILKYNSSVDATGKITKMRITFIPPEDIEHCYFELNPETKRGVSGLLRSLLPAKLFACLYISNVLLQLTRGFDKRVYYVRQTVDTNIAGTLMNVINQIQRSNFNMRQIESMSNVLNMVGRFNDLVIPRSASGEAPVDFEVIQGQQVDIKNDLMNMLEEMAVNATDVPFEVTQSRQQVDYATHLTMTNTKFLQKIYNRQGKTQKIFSRIVSKIYNYEYNLDTDKHDSITVQLPPPIYLNAQNSGQIVDAVNGLTANVAGAFVDDQNEADLMNELRRQLQQDMISSLFPPGFIEKCMVRAKLELAKKNPSDENM